MNKQWFSFLILFGKSDVWSRKNLLHKFKEETVIDEAIKLGYIEQCSLTDIGDPQYRITQLGIKVRDN